MGATDYLVVPSLYAFRGAVVARVGHSLSGHLTLNRVLFGEGNGRGSSHPDTRTGSVSKPCALAAQAAAHPVRSNELRMPK